jgi:hypothetical protein
MEVATTERHEHHQVIAAIAFVFGATVLLAEAF